MRPALYSVLCPRCYLLVFDRIIRDSEAIGDSIDEDSAIVFEIINKCPDSFYGEFSLGDRVGPLNAFGQASLQPGEKFYLFVPNVSQTPGSLVALSNPKATVSIGYSNGTTCTPVSEREKVQLDLNIPPKSE